MNKRLTLNLLIGIGFIVSALGATGGANGQDVGRAVARAGEYLKSTQPGRYGQRLGGVALVGLALREGGVPENDPVVRRAAEFVAQHAPSDTNTYDVALSIMFLDKLTRSKDTTQSTKLKAGLGPAPQPKRLKSGRILTGHQVDQSNLIETLGQRLKSGQGPGGGWHYQCNSPRDGDHSNTQFGVLGLWVAGQHGVDVAENLRRCANHFRGCQNPTGGWGYSFGASGDRASMTCAGMIALATSLGLEPKLRAGGIGGNVGAQEKDANVEAGLKLLATYVATSTAFSNDLYFAWSLERVGVLYGLRKIGQIDWHSQGAAALLAVQQADGSWRGSYGPDIDTSFAILFLTKANISPELSNALAGRFGDGARMKSFVPGTDPMKAMGLSDSDLLKFRDQSGGSLKDQLRLVGVGDLFTALDEMADPASRQAIVAELEKRQASYSEVKDQVEEIWALTTAGDARLAAIARRHIASAFQVASMPHCMYWIGQDDQKLSTLIWQQVDARIRAADAARKAKYCHDGLTVLRYKREGQYGFSLASRQAALDLLGKFKDREAAAGVAEQLIEMPRELWPQAGEALRAMTGLSFGPYPGDDIGKVLDAQKKWRASLK